MELDLLSIIYLIVRLSPLLVVSQFTLQSILNQDSKGVVYLTGLIFTCLFVVVTGKAISVGDRTEITANDVVCKSMGFGDYPNVSLSQVVLGFTYGYLMYIIYKFAGDGQPDYSNSNMPTIILFPILIVSNGIWNLSNSCASMSVLFLSAGLGAAGGCLWAFAIQSAGYKHFALFNGISNQAICSKPSKTRFKCVNGGK